MIKKLLCCIKNWHKHNYIDDYEIYIFPHCIRLTVTTYCGKCLKQYCEKVYRCDESRGPMILTNTDYIHGLILHKINNVNDFIMQKGRW